MDLLSTCCAIICLVALIILLNAKEYLSIYLQPSKLSEAEAEVGDKVMMSPLAQLMHLKARVMDRINKI